MQKHPLQLGGGLRAVQKRRAVVHELPGGGVGQAHQVVHQAAGLRAVHELLSLAAVGVVHVGVEQGVLELLVPQAHFGGVAARADGEGPVVAVMDDVGEPHGADAPELGDQLARRTDAAEHRVGADPRPRLGFALAHVGRLDAVERESLHPVEAGVFGDGAAQLRHKRARGMLVQAGDERGEVVVERGAAVGAPRMHGGGQPRVVVSEAGVEVDRGALVVECGAERLVDVVGEGARFHRRRAPALGGGGGAGRRRGAEALPGKPQRDAEGDVALRFARVDDDVVFEGDVVDARPVVYAESRGARSRLPVHDAPSCTPQIRAACRRAVRRPLAPLYRASLPSSLRIPVPPCALGFPPRPAAIPPAARGGAP